MTSIRTLYRAVKYFGGVLARLSPVLGSLSRFLAGFLPVLIPILGQHGTKQGAMSGMDELEGMGKTVWGL